MPKVLRIAKARKVEEVAGDVAVALGEWDVKAALLQTLIPLGFEAARALFEEEVTALAGPRYARHDTMASRTAFAGAASRGPSTWRTRNSPCRSPGYGIARRTPRSRSRRTPGSSNPAPPITACYGGSSTG